MFLEEGIKFVNTFVALFVIIDPFAVIPVYLSLTDRFSPEGVAHTRKRATLVGLGILMTFASTGLSVFNLFGITLPAFQIAGGILLLLFGIAQLNGTRSRVKPEETDEGRERDDISVFPLGMPLLAGPGAISTVVLYATQGTSVWDKVRLLLAIVASMVATYYVLKWAHSLFQVLGRTGLNLFTRLMGLILTAVAIQFILNGIKATIDLLKAA